MLLLMWMAGCSLVALASVALSRSDGPWLLASAAIVGVVMLLLDRFVLSGRLSGARGLSDPIARDFARVRREGSHLAVATISLAGPRGSSRALARIARELVAGLRMTDAVVRVATARALVVVLPGADGDVATAVLGRAPAGERTDVLLGIATFPEDGQTFASLKEVARSRERAWPRAPGPGDDGGPGTSGGPKIEPNGSRPARPTTEDRASVLLETRPLASHLRRGADLLVLTLTAPIVLPLVALLAIAVKLDSPGPAIVRIGRLGRDGRPFELFKLRSMTRDADRMKEELKHLNTLPWPDFKIAEDPRVTRLGRLLRKYSLDELPQLYNVLRGEMTLVGPRPCSVKLADYDLWQSERLDVTPGVVGRWQAEGRGSVDFAERCRLDIRQARSRSIRANLRLVVATVRSVFVSKGAY